MSATKFKELLTKTENYLPTGKRFTRRGKQIIPFAKLKEIGIGNFTTLKKEYQKVKSRSSNRTRSEREIIKLAYALCLQTETSFINVLEYQNYLVEKAKNKENSNPKIDKNE